MIDICIAGVAKSSLIDAYGIMSFKLDRDITGSLAWREFDKYAHLRLRLQKDPLKLKNAIKNVKRAGYYWVGRLQENVDFDGMPYEKHPVLGPIAGAHQDKLIYCSAPISQSLGTNKYGVYKLVRFLNGEFPHDVEGLIDGNLYWVREARFSSVEEAKKHYPITSHSQFSFSSHVHSYYDGKPLFERGKA